MKPRTIVVAVLLAFVAASIAYLLLNEIPARRSGIAQPVKNVGRVGDSAADKVVVYYFHGNVRCSNCRKFEAYSQEAIQGAFSASLGNGRLEWKVINVDEPANKHFIEDYRLITRTVIVSKSRGGNQVEWKNLEKIWELVSNKPAFVKYIQNEVTAYLGNNT